MTRLFYSLSQNFGETFYDFYNFLNENNFWTIIRAQNFVNKLIFLPPIVKVLNYCLRRHRNMRKADRTGFVSDDSGCDGLCFVLPTLDRTFRTFRQKKLILSILPPTLTATKV